MLTAIALDDERPALEVLETFATALPGLELRATFTSVAAARDYLTKQPTELIFLDINMPGGSGLELARELPKETQVIFTTSYAEFALESYEVNATDYLLKPFSRDRFREAVARARELAAARRPVPEPLLLRVNYGTERVHPTDIRYVEALDNYLRIHRGGGAKTLTVRMTMRELRALLPAGDFVRIHRSYIVRMGAVTALRSKTVYLGETALPLGGTYEARFAQWFGGEC